MTTLLGKSLRKVEGLRTTASARITQELDYHPSMYLSHLGKRTGRKYSARKHPDGGWVITRIV
jgi:hypothetical protein